MNVKKVLNIEDTITKHIAIQRSLNKCGITNIDHATNAMEGIAMIENAKENGNPYDVIVSDMYFPLSSGEKETDAGMYVIEELKNRGMNIPVIVCSSCRLYIPEIVGCIYYNELRGDLDADMKEMIEKVEKGLS